MGTLSRPDPSKGEAPAADSYAIAGEQAKAQATIVDLSEMSSHQYGSPFCTAIIYLGLGDKERALAGLEKAYEAYSQWIVVTKTTLPSTRFVPIRASSRC